MYAWKAPISRGIIQYLNTAILQSTKQLKIFNLKPKDIQFKASKPYLQPSQFLGLLLVTEGRMNLDFQLFDS